MAQLEVTRSGSSPGVRSTWPGLPETNFAGSEDDWRSEAQSPRCRKWANFEGESLDQTKTLHRFDLSQLRLQLEDAVVLDLNLVRDALSKYGPILDDVVDQIDWTWYRTPSHIESAITDETRLYPYLQWIIFRTAARALPAVLHCLSAKSSGGSKFPKVSSTAIESQRSFGSTDIIHYSLEEPTTDIRHKKIHTLHEVKRARVLMRGETLQKMYRLAGSSWSFRKNGDQCPRGKALLCQAIDELAIHEVKHIVLTTETHYALVYLGDDYQLHMSQVHNIRESPTQAEDMARLVLFTLIPCRVEVPSFPTSVFKPYKGKIHLGHGVRSVEGYAEESRHEGDIRITFIKLIFTIFQRRHGAVAKASYGFPASHRVLHEFHAYNALHSLQGYSIPTLYGLYHSKYDGSSLVLITSYEGKALHSFALKTVCLPRTLLSHLIRIHQAGIEHLDVELRNVVLSKSKGPVVVDVDGASLDHSCEGLSCGELREVARRLGINLAAELSTTSKTTSVVMHAIFAQLQSISTEWPLILRICPLWLSRDPVTDSNLAEFHCPLRLKLQPDVVYKLIAKVTGLGAMREDEIGHFITKIKIRDTTYLYNDLARNGEATTSRSVAEIKADFEKLPVPVEKAPILILDDSDDDEVGKMLMGTLESDTSQNDDHRR
ncbi:hypothetical protein C8J57DRAFT_1527134 [Mycena rebaudengoi]|nr:hypothetical protein C8J57DRAFT_1527134 [Mycena rebaudengoi]